MIKIILILLLLVPFAAAETHINNDKIIFEKTNMPTIGLYLFGLSFVFMTIGTINERRKNNRKDN